MRKKKTFFLAGVCILGTVAAISALVFMVKHVPSFYRRADMAPGKDRKELSTACLGRFLKLGECWIDGKNEWEVTFSEAQVNSYFEEDFIRLGDADALRKQGISDPRVVLENDKLRVAFRYGSGAWSAVVSYDLRLWLAPKDVNVVCIEILGRHAGALPISSQSLLNEISEVAGRRGVEVTWYRHEGNPVALVRFQTDRSRSAIPQLRRLEIKQGHVTIGGHSQEPQLSSTLKKALVPVGN